MNAGSVNNSATGNGVQFGPPVDGLTVPLDDDGDFHCGSSPVHVNGLNHRPVEGAMAYCNSVPSRYGAMASSGKCDKSLPRR